MAYFEKNRRKDIREANKVFTFVFTTQSVRPGWNKKEPFL